MKGNEFVLNVNLKEAQKIEKLGVFEINQQLLALVQENRCALTVTKGSSNWTTQRRN